MEEIGIFDHHPAVSNVLCAYIWSSECNSYLCSEFVMMGQIVVCVALFGRRTPLEYRIN